MIKWILKNVKFATKLNINKGFVKVKNVNKI